MIDLKTLDEEFDRIFKAEARVLIERIVEPSEIGRAVEHLASRYKVLATNATRVTPVHHATVTLKEFRTAEENFKKLSQGFSSSVSMTEYIELTLWLSRLFELKEVDIAILKEDGEEFFEVEVKGMRVASELFDKLSHFFSMQLRNNLVSNEKVRTVFLELKTESRSVSIETRASALLES